MITSLIKKTNKSQTGNIVFNLDDFRDEDIAFLKKRIFDKIDGDLKRLDELLVIKDNEVTSWYLRGD